MTMETHKKKMEETFGTKGHPKADLLYKLAWDYGHAYGYYEVEHFYQELADLIVEKEKK